MGFHVRGIKRASFTSSRDVSKSAAVPKGYLIVYGGENMKRFLNSISYLSQHSSQELLSQAEEQFEYNHPMGLTIPCKEDVFFDITPRLNRL